MIRKTSVAAAIAVLLAMSVQCALEALAPVSDGVPIGPAAVQLVLVPVAVILCCIVGGHMITRIAGDAGGAAGAVRVSGIAGIACVGVAGIIGYLGAWTPVPAWIVGVACLWVALIAYLAGSRRRDAGPGPDPE
ncbi:hypothetical protein [Corynebacterium sp.]|uniref:hypothetical protein n=1 Tax=Corynebacterium sp. TaxID=1720 RepID=UPI0026DC708F|nr:hypothetical protein [Corynebacterium sp.]MDO4609813.1 hypothetical protein [Corynebacterium sp.]